MRAALLTAVVGAVAMAGCIWSTAASAAAADEAEIKALEARFAAAFNAKDIDAIMKVYVPGKSLLVFDVVPPRQYVGSDAYHKDWENFFAMFKGPVKFDISDLAVETGGGTIAYSHSIQHFVGTDTKGRPVDATVRVTDGYRKVNGHWLVEHEHVSVPVDLDTGKPDMTSKP
jgi:uncharacterized protein (TIGR02246 family)